MFREGFVSSPPVAAHEVGEAYLDLHHQLHRICDQAMGAAGLTLARAKVLNRLDDMGPMNQATLAGLLGHAPRSVTETVDALERDGLVEREVTAAVPVRVDYRLTPLGAGLHRTLLHVKEWAEAHVEEVLDARDRYDAESG